MATASPDDPARVLIVDDDAAGCWALEQVLTRSGYQVQIAADAAAARRSRSRVRSRSIGLGR